MRGLLFSAVMIAACARAATDLGDTDSGAPGDGGACSFDTMTDPKHCGACDNACAAGQVCSNGACKATCDAPLLKCAGDAGAICADIKSDPNHCGSCAKVCVGPDAGAMPPGTNNPEGGVPYDGGPGWSYGAPTCAMGTCGTACSGGMTACSDGLCYDTQNHHDHCGDCNTQCMADTEWCNKGHCCTTDKMWCNGSCIDVSTDPMNCGGCGNTCSGMTPYCYGGKCTMACSPSGQRVAFNTLSSKTTTGCWTGNPCAQSGYVWTSTNGQSFNNANEEIVCGGASGCVTHVGITTYQLASNCQGTWDVYCDSTKVGTIDTTNKGCQGDALNNGCSVSFQPQICKSIKFVGKTGSVGACCASTGVHSMITGTAAW